MRRNELDSVSLFNAFVSGGYEVIERREQINKLNVFPVADGDTGSNLAMTMSAFIDHSRPLPTIGVTMRSLADAALSGARGNSGIIFAQFLFGLGETFGETLTISCEAFADATRYAEMRAREAILAPVEGTILTLIKDWVGLLDEHKHLRDFGLIFQRTLKGAKRSLDNTPKLLPALRRAKVVDAGAEGFFRFLSGMTKYLVSDRVEAVRHPAPPPLGLHHPSRGGGYPPFRYCTEVLIRGAGIDIGKVRSELAAFGDCGMAAGGPGMVRAHVHTDDPASVVRILAVYGSVGEQKVDDMLREYEVVHARKYPIAIVTDSVCDLPEALIDRHQINVIPMNIALGDAQYLDGLTISGSQVLEGMETDGSYPSSSQPSPAAFSLLYSFLSTYYESIIAIHVSGKLSGTYSLSAREAAKIGGKRISVIDSRQNSGAQALVVLRAAELVAEGRSHDEVVAAVEASIPKARILVSVPSLKYMVKGGRVSPLKGALANLLNLKPIVSLDEEGRALLSGKAFSRRRNLDRIVAMAAAFIGEGKLRGYAVVHAGDREAAEAFAARLEAATGSKPLFIQAISPIIALNAGPDTMAVALMKE